MKKKPLFRRILKSLSKINFFNYLILGVLIILYVTLYTDLEFKERFVNVLTPFITLFTGILIYLTFRENAKSNKIAISEKLYQNFLNELELHKKNNTISFEGQTFVEDITTPFIDDSYDPILEKLEGSDMINWHQSLVDVILELEREKYFYPLNEEFDKSPEDFTLEKFRQYRALNLYHRMDYFLGKVIDYYKFLQDNLLGLVTKEFDDFTPQDRILLISKIVGKTEYNQLFRTIHNYLHLEEDGKVVLTTNAIPPNFNIEVVEQTLKTKGYKIGHHYQKRYLVDWTMFKDFYKTHLYIQDVANKEREGLF